MSARSARVARRLLPPLLGSLVAASLLQASPASAAAPRWSIVRNAHVGTFTGVSGLSGTDLWVVGYFYNQPTAQYLPVTQHWDGTRFTYHSAPAATHGYNAFNAVAEVSANDVWAVGYQTPVYYTWITRPLIEHWNGSAWSIVPSPFTGQGELKAIVALAANDIWVAGTRTVNPYGTLILHYDGTRWSVVEDGHPSDGSQLNGVAATSSTSVWFGGAIPAQDGTLDTFVERWNGSSFVTESTPSVDEYSEFAALSAEPSGTVWGVGWQSPDIGYFEFAARSDGTTWAMQDVPGGPANNNLYGVKALSATKAWAVGYDSTNGIGPLILTWSGSSWVEDPNPARTCCTLYAINSVGNQLWAVGDGLVMRRST
jgi:hypothetical protein